MPDLPPQDPPADPPPKDPPPKDPPIPNPDHFSAKLGGELANHPGMAKFADATALGKSYLELETRLSEQGVRVPGEDASPEAIAEYREAIGVPKTIDGYEVASNLKLPADVAWDTDFQNEMVTAMHEEGLTPPQVTRVLQKYADRQGTITATAIEGAKANKESSSKLLRQEWGSAYDANIRVAHLAMEEIFGDGMKAIATTKLLDGSMLGINPAFIRAMAKVGEDYSEHDIHGMGERKRMTMTPEEASAEIVKLRSDTVFQAAYLGKDDPGHQAAVDRMNNLYAMKSAGG